MTKIKIFRYCSIVLIILFMFPLLRGYIVIKDYIFLIGYSSLCFLLYPKAFLNKSILFLIIYLFILLLFYREHEVYDFKFMFLEFFSFFSLVSLINICVYNKDTVTFVSILQVILIVLIATLLLTVPILINNPNAIRDTVMLNVSGKEDLMQLTQQSGIVSYGTIHCLPFIFPVLVYHLKQGIKWKYKLFIAFTLILFSFILVNAGTTTPLMQSLFGVFLGLIIQKDNNRNFLMLLILGIIYYLFIGNTLLLSILDSIQPYFSESSIGEKISDFQILLKYGEVSGQLEGREDLYNVSWNTFFENPLMGSSLLKDGGGHAYFVDKLAYLGLLGTVPLFFFFYFQIRRSYFWLHREVKFYYLAGILLFLILGFSKNLGGFDYWIFLFFLLPVLSFFSLKI